MIAVPASDMTRLEAFLAHIASGGKVEATDWMPEEYRAALLRFIEMHANSELMGVLPEREWIMRAPSLQRKLALTAKVQDEVGHAQLLYRLAEDLGKSRAQMMDDLLAGRTKFHNVFHYPTHSWGDVGVIAWLVDAAAILSQKALLGTSYSPYARTMQRICWEESFHIKHGYDIVVTLAGGASFDTRVPLLMVALSLFYVGGMFLNDGFDREVDARERPERPLPSGRATPREVFAIGFGLLAAGLVLLATMAWLGPGPHAVRRLVTLVSILSGLASLAPVPTDAGILFARDTTVPPSVQEFAWRMIEKRCSYQSYERGQRSFWAYEARTRRVAADIVYSINILSEVTWKKTEPPAIINMIVVDDGRMRLAAIRSSFIPCASPPEFAVP